MKKLLSTTWILIALISLLASCNSPKPNSGVEDVISDASAKFAPDKRVAILKIEADETKNGTVVLKGETNLEEAHTFILNELAAKNLQVIDSVQLLPAAKLGDKVWGLVTLSAIPMRKNPDYPEEMVSQTIMGTPIKIYDKEDGWYLIQTPDQYLGWVSGSGIVSLTESELESWKKSNRYVFTQISGSVFDAPQNNAAIVSDLVLGSIFEVENSANGFLKMSLPDGREGFVPASDCQPFAEWEAIEPNAENVIKTAKKMLGSPYLWGGTSSKAIDCSGFTKTSYFSQGVMLARDASQQARYGEQLDVNDFQFEPGDLLFFGRSKERITHVGLYLGNGQFIHSSGRVRINSFNPEDDNYEPNRKKTLVAASRVLNSLNQGQIIQIKNHPWYN